MKGPHWQHFGQKKGGKMLLNPQEALFLLEQVQTVVKVNVGIVVHFNSRMYILIIIILLLCNNQAYY